MTSLRGQGISRNGPRDAVLTGPMSIVQARRGSQGTPMRAISRGSSLSESCPIVLSGDPPWLAPAVERGGRRRHMVNLADLHVGGRPCGPACRPPPDGGQMVLMTPRGPPGKSTSVTACRSPSWRTRAPAGSGGVERRSAHALDEPVGVPGSAEKMMRHFEPFGRLHDPVVGDRRHLESRIGNGSRPARGRQTRASTGPGTR